MNGTKTNKYDMRLVVRTKVDVTFNTGKVTSITDKIVGEIQRVEQNGSFDSLNVKYSYKNIVAGAEEGSDDVETILETKTYSLRDEEIDNLRSSVEALLPADYGTMTEREQNRIKHLTGFRLVMADTFSLDVADTEIIDLDA